MSLQTHLWPSVTSYNCQRHLCFRSSFFREQSKYADKASRMNRGSWHFPFPPSRLQHFDFPLPSPVRLFEMVVAPEQEYPLVCIGVSRGSTHSAPVHVDYINLNSNTSWFTNTGLGMFWRLFMCISKVSGHHYLKFKKKKNLLTLLLMGVFLCPLLVPTPEKPCAEVVQVRQLDSSSLLVLIESTWHKFY